MKYTFLLLIWLLAPMAAIQADNLTQTVSIVPTPAQMMLGEGVFRFTTETSFAVENNAQAEVVRQFTELMKTASGFTPSIHIGTKKGDIRLSTLKKLKNEAYQLDITPKGITIKASDAKGFFYALQTIRLLLPASIESKQVVETSWEIPAVTISDEPRFGYRGLMLDVARCFIPKEAVLRIIDCMGMLKVNKLHFHLGDDNGWRLEIKKYPKLTEVGAWRVDRTDVPFSHRRNQKLDEPTPIGGFYTQEDIKEIVAYAEKRQIEVIPEIEMPAHAMASLAAYPELACPVVKEFIGVVPGMGGGYDGVIYCAGKESVFTFLQDVIDEVITMFPSRYIHLGGDEAVKTNWKKCPLCQERMKKEQLMEEEDLQGYFMKRMGNYVRSKGKEIMGWDELTNTTIPEGTIIFGWQQLGQAALKAAEQGHRFVMTPARIMYLIRYQGPQWFEPVTYFGNNTLKNVYDYEPIQPDWKPEYAKLLMGVQASLWTEFCNNSEDAEYLIFPRLAALAEVAWTRPEQKEWGRFLKGMDRYNEHIAEKGIVYARSMYNIQHTVTPDNGALKVMLECIRPDVEIRYTIDGSEPNAAASLYANSLMVTSGQTIKSATFCEGKQMGQTLVLPIGWNKATAKPILNAKGKASVLTNGIRGSLKQSDFEWHSFESNDSISFTIDLQKQEEIQTFTLGCITNYGMSIHKPACIQVAVSDDNRNFKTAAQIVYQPEEIFQNGTYTDDCALQLKGAKARYVRVTVKGPGLNPAGHIRPGAESRILFDEIIIN